MFQKSITDWSTHYTVRLNVSHVWNARLRTNNNVDACVFLSVSKQFPSHILSIAVYAPNFEKVGTYWFRLVRMYVFMFEISS